jgi:hypothetical protein
LSFGVVGATLFNFRVFGDNPESRGLVNHDSQKIGPVTGRVWYTLSKPALPIKKSHAAEPFEKEERLGAAEPCLFGDNIITKWLRVCQVEITRKLQI